MLRFSPEWYPDQKGLDVRLVSRRTGGFWRVSAYWGTPPGSHIGFWRTRFGAVRGFNYRFGRRINGPCLTILTHWRRGER